MMLRVTSLLFLVGFAYGQDCGTVDYNGNTVSDPATQGKLQEIANLFCSTLLILEGDVFDGSGSLHDQGRAADYKVEGYEISRPVYEELVANSDMFMDSSWDVTYSGSVTCTDKHESLHLAHYPDDRGTCFSEEGTTEENICVFPCEYVPPQL